jgi:2-polyprenyl-6-methoxyphenol hydroxylase-like FAD-dependent oxidoreductase
MNAGIADAHNLAWKLASVVRGKARERLLEARRRAPSVASSRRPGASPPRGLHWNPRSSPSAAAGVADR